MSPTSVRANRPSGEKTAEWQTPGLSLSKICRSSLPVDTSHNVTNSLQDRAKRPSGDNATEETSL